MMNSIKVTFDGMRIVYANGRALGDTNEILLLGEDGTYTFDLGDPKNYQPHKRTCQVSGTSRRNPLVIKFNKES